MRDQTREGKCASQAHFPSKRCYGSLDMTSNSYLQNE
jgi:hypothetical protein